MESQLLQPIKSSNISFTFIDTPGIIQNKPQVIIGDFNSHSMQWGYNEINEDGEAVEAGSDAYQLSLIHDSQLPKSFNSGHWKRGSNPGLIFISNTTTGLNNKMVLEPIPHSHRQ